LATDLKGRDGIFSIDANTGRVVPLVLPISLAERPTYTGFFWSPDQKRLYFQRQNGTVVERDLASGQERILAPKSSPTDARCGHISLSPDGRLIATCRSNASTNSQALVLIPVDGGNRRELLRVTSPETAGDRFTWTPDGRGLLFARTSTYSPDDPLAYHVTDLWLVSTTGGAPRKLELDASRIYPYASGRIHLNPDGRQLAYTSGRRHAEIWVLENFLPALKASR
jgi:Tol biopolymer transport system component